MSALDSTDRIAAIPSRWSAKRLDFVASIKARLGWRGLKAEEYVDEGYILLSTPNIKGANIDFRDVNYITKARYDESPEIMLSEGDVLVVKDGATLGIVSIVERLPAPATVNGSIAVVRPNEMCASRFLYYWLSSRSIQQRIEEVKGGMGVPHLFQSDLRRFPIAFPTPAEQREIADFLDEQTRRIDRLIALRRRQIELLYEQQAALIKRAVTRGLDPSVPMKETGLPLLGQIPAHWEIKHLKYIARFVQTGATPPSSDERFYVDDGIDWYGPGDFVSDIVLGHSSRRISLAAVDQGHARVYEPPVILIVGIGASVGKVGLSYERCFTNQQVNAIGLRDEYSATFFAYLLATYSESISANSNSSTPPIFTQTQTKNIIVPVPPQAEQLLIVEFIVEERKTTEALASVYVRQNELLTEYRTALIQECVTGQRLIEPKLQVVSEAA
jgi:type I restriction enzyme S subunit